MSEARIRPHRLAITVMAAVLAVSATCGADGMTPPLLQIGRLDAVTIDGRVGGAEWEGATESGVLVGPDGLPTDLPVRVRLGWDDGGLLLLWDVLGEPVFTRRKRDSDFRGDDAVEVRLQAGEDAPLHHFAIAAGGAIYDARDGDSSWDAPWRALALRSPDAWRVEMRIPFSALDAPPGGTLRANLVLNDGTANAPVAAWTAPGPDGTEQLGFLRLANTGSPVTLESVRVDGDAITINPRFSGQASVRVTLFEGETEVLTRETTQSAPLQISLPHPGSFRLRLAGAGPDGELVLQRELALTRRPPLVIALRKRLLAAREVEVQIDGAGLSAEPDLYTIAVTGAEPVEVRPGPGRRAEATVDLTPCAAGEVTVTVTARAGEAELAGETLSFVLPERPAWAGSTRGKHARVMEPWTPVVVAGSRVRCRDLVYDLGEQPLPVSITSGRRELLAAPVKLRARVGEVMRDWESGTLRWLETSDRRAVAAISALSPLAEARVRATCEYDGLMTFDVKVDPRGDERLTEVRLEIPVLREFATHMQVAGGTPPGVTAGSTPRGGWTGALPSLAWLTGYERGLRLVCGSDAGGLLDDPSEALRIEAGRGRTVLMLTMLDHELAPGQPFETSFAMQATPAVPIRDDRHEWRSAVLSELPLAGGACDAAALEGLRERRVRTVVLDDERYMPRPGGLGEAADELVAEFARACHDAGLRLMLVLDDDLTRDAVWEAFRGEVAVDPSADPADARPSPGSAWADYAVEAAAYAMSRYEADGIHLRGGVVGAQCDAEAARALMVRLRTVVREANADGLLTLEAPDGALGPAVSFADALVVAGVDAEGEPLAIDEFVARGGTGAAGPAVEVRLPAGADRPALAGALGLALLHDAALRPEPGDALEAATDVRKAQERFGIATALWRPWWAGRPLVSAQEAGVLASTWSRDDEALAVVANRTEGNPVVEIAPDRERLKLGAWLRGVDMITGKRVPQIGEVLRTRMEPWQTSLVHVSTRQERDVEIDE